MKGAQLCLASVLPANFKLGLVGLQGQQLFHFEHVRKFPSQYFITMVPRSSTFKVPSGSSMTEKNKSSFKRLTNK